MSLTSSEPASAREIIDYVKALPPRDMELMKGVLLRTPGFFDTLTLDDVALISVHTRNLRLSGKEITQTDA